MIDFWVETALECFNTGNFNSLMAILTALNLNAIARLKKTVSFLTINFVAYYDQVHFSGPKYRQQSSRA